MRLLCPKLVCLVCCSIPWYFLEAFAYPSPEGGPVSYTHLDVYKRQALAQAPGTKDPDLEAILAVDAAARQSVAVAARGIVR